MTAMITVDSDQWRQRLARFPGELAEYRALAGLLAERCTPAVRVLGLSGAQGTGKSTLAGLLGAGLGYAITPPAMAYLAQASDAQRELGQTYTQIQTQN